MFALECWGLEDMSTTLSLCAYVNPCLCSLRESLAEVSPASRRLPADPAAWGDWCICPGRPARVLQELPRRGWAHSVRLQPPAQTTHPQGSFLFPLLHQDNLCGFWHYSVCWNTIVSTFSLFLGRSQEIPQLWDSRRDDGGVEVSELRLSEGGVHQHVPRWEGDRIRLPGCCKADQIRARVGGKGRKEGRRINEIKQGGGEKKQQV